MRIESYFYNCSPEYINSIDKELMNEIRETIVDLPKRSTQAQINHDLLWMLADKGWDYDSLPSRNSHV